MRVQIQKWGNSLALRLPKAFAVESNLGLNSEVEMTLEQGRIVIIPVVSPRTRLEELVDKITDENAHPEYFAGPPVGNEVW